VASPRGLFLALGLNMNWRLPFGFLLAPIVPCAIAALPNILATHEWSGDLLTYMVVVSQIIGVVFGAPLYAVLSRSRHVRLVHCLVSGAGIAIAIAAILVLLNPSSSADDSGGATIVNGHYTVYGWVQNAKVVASMGLLGTSIGLFFWGIALWVPKSAQQVNPADVPSARR